jgi:hypothetical protein
MFVRLWISTEKLFIARKYWVLTSADRNYITVEAIISDRSVIAGECNNPRINWAIRDDNNSINNGINLHGLTGLLEMRDSD